MTENKTKKGKLTLEMVVKEFSFTADEMVLVESLKALKFTPAKIRDKVLKDRKDKEKELVRENAKKELAQKAVEKAQQAKNLYNELQNLPKFTEYKNPLFRIRNISNYTNFRHREWEVYGEIEWQGERYAVTLEYTKEGLFATSCWINLEDVYVEYSDLMILDYENTRGCYPMEYEKVE